MKKIIFILATALCLLLGYILGNFFPLNVFDSQQNEQLFNLSINKDEGIQGKARLEVTLKMDNGYPLNNVEVDLAEKPGPPPIGGVALSDENGLAVFNVKPGKYFIFFNDNNFPRNIETPELIQVELTADKVNQKTLVLNVK